MVRRIVRLAVISAAVVLLATPGAALAAESTHVIQQAAPRSLITLSGTLWNYTAASTSGDGSISILVNRGTFDHRVLHDTTLTFVVTSRTTVSPYHHTISNGDRGTLLVRVLAPPTNVAVRDNLLSIVDQGPKPPVVVFVLRGTLSDYTAARAVALGSVTIRVKTSNLEPRVFNGTTLTFSTTTKTTVLLSGEKSISNGDRGIVKVRVSKLATALDLQSGTPFEVVDEGPALATSVHPAFQVSTGSDTGTRTPR